MYVHGVVNSLYQPHACSNTISKLLSKMPHTIYPLNQELSLAFESLTVTRKPQHGPPCQQARLHVADAPTA